MKKGFTLIEIMVATVLMTMLVTVLTMVFNQSSIAWSTGLAAVTGLDRAREDIATISSEAENAITDDRGVSVLRIMSVFDDDVGGMRESTGRTLTETFTARERPTANAMRDGSGANPTYTVTGSAAVGHDSFIVGIVSYGPDGETGGDHSWDDISTLPEEIVK